MSQPLARDCVIVAKSQWTASVKQLEHKERELRETLREHVKHILEGKRFFVWQELIDKYNLPDKNLLNDTKGGFKLSGWLPTSGSSPSQLKRPEYSVSSFLVLASRLNKPTFEMCMKAPDSELENSAWEETMEEEKAGWVWRCDDESLTDKAAARRFGIRHRVIDDCNCCGVNFTIGLAERLVLPSTIARPHTNNFLSA